MVGQRQDVVNVKIIYDSLDTMQETLVGTEVSAESVGTTDNETVDDGMLTSFSRYRHRNT